MLNIVPVRVREIVAIHSPFIFFLLNIEKLIYESFRHFTQFIFFAILRSKHETSESESLDVVRGQITWIVERSGPLRRESSFPSNNREKILSHRW